MSPVKNFPTRLYLKPMALRMSSRSSEERKFCFLTSKRLKHSLSTLISSTSSAVASVISSKSMSANCSGGVQLI